MRLQPSRDWSDEVVELFLLEPHDAGPHYVAWLNDPEVNRYLESRFVTHDEASVRAFVEGCIRNPDVLLLGVRHRDTNRHVGNVKLEVNRAHRRGEVGILIGDREVQGRGLATRTIMLLCRIASIEFGLRKLTAGCYASNKGSERAFAKAGFSIEGVRPAHYLVDGLPEALVLMGRML